MKNGSTYLSENYHAVETDNLYLAALAIYCGNYSVIRVQSDKYDKSIFTLNVPEEDWRLIVHEFENDGTVTSVKRYADSVMVAFSLIRKSRRNGGLWDAVDETFNFASERRGRR